MAKKKTVSVKNVTSSTKKPQVSKTTAAASGIHEQNINILPPSVMNGILAQERTLMNEFKSIADNNLTALQRRRKVGAGIRNYGFIEKVSKLAEANPHYAHFFKVDDLKNSIVNIKMCRDIVILLQAFSRAVSNTMMVYSDDAFSMSLIYYNMVKEMSRRGSPSAIELFHDLKTYFRKTKRASGKPTKKELERDARALIRGKKDGKLLIENESPKVIAGKRKVIDDVHNVSSARGKTAVREEEER